MKIFAIIEPETSCARRNSCSEVGALFGQRCDGIARQVVNLDQARQELISHLVRQVLQSSKKQKLTQELFPDEGSTFTAMSDQAKSVVKE